MGGGSVSADRVLTAVAPKRARCSSTKYFPMAPEPMGLGHTSASQACRCFFDAFQLQPPLSLVCGTGPTQGSTGRGRQD